MEVEYDFQAVINSSMVHKAQQELQKHIPAVREEHRVLDVALDSASLYASLTSTPIGRGLTLIPSIARGSQKQMLGMEKQRRRSDLCGKVIQIQGSKVRVKDDQDQKFLFQGQQILWPGKYLFANGSFTNKVFCSQKSVSAKQDIKVGSIPGHSKIMVAAGPFSSSENLNYLGLKLVAKLADKFRPDTIFLLGPFLDIKNKLLQECQLFNQEDGVITLDAFFMKVVRLLEINLHYSPQIKFQPSCRDIHHPFPIPQRAFNLDQDNFRSIPNPAVLKASNNSVISVINTDVIKAIDSRKFMPLRPKGNLLQTELEEILNQPNIVPCSSDPINQPWRLRYEQNTPALIIMRSELRPQLKKISQRVIMTLPGLMQSQEGYVGLLSSQGAQLRAQILQVRNRQ